MEENIGGWPGKAKVALLDDFHYKGLPPKPLKAALERCTFVAFYITENTAKMARKERILDELNVLIAMSKHDDSCVKGSMVFGHGENSRRVLKGENDYITTLADEGWKYYNVDDRDNFANKMYQYVTLHVSAEERIRAQQKHPTNSFSGQVET
jgi:hypothetical protein